MPLLQPQQTRIASGGASDVTGTDIYVKAGSGSTPAVIPGNLTVSGGTILAGPATVSQIIAQDATGARVRMATTAGVSAVGQTNSSGVLTTPGLVFDAGSLKIVDTAGNAQAEVPPAGGISMTSTLTMNNEEIVLDTTGTSSLAFDSVNVFPVLKFPVGRAVVFSEDTVAVANIGAGGVNAAAYSSTPNSTAAPISVPTATPTTIFTIPLSGGTNYTKIWKILVGVSDGATNYDTYYVDVGVFWLGTTSPHYAVVNSANLPVGWSLTVPLITSGAVEFTHTFGSALDVFVSSVVMGQNIP
jgi:hypothetical protein